MNIFPIFKKFWSPAEDEWLDSDEIVGYEALSLTGVVLGKGESQSEALESALLSSYMTENAEIKLDPKLLKRHKGTKARLVL